MIGHLLNRDVDVYRSTSTPDGRGGRSVSRSKVGTIRAKVGQAQAAEVEVASRDGARLTHVVHMAAGAGVRRGDEVEVGATRLRVLAAVTNSRGTYLRLDCEVMQHGD